MADEEAGSAAKSRDPWFNPFRYPVGENAKTVVARAIADLEGYEERRGLRKRARRLNDQRTFETAVSALVCDLTYRYLADPKGMGEVAVTRSKTILGRASRYHPSALGKTLPTILDRLADPHLAYISQNIGNEGFFEPARCTTIRAGERLQSQITSHGVRLEDLGLSGNREVIELKRGKTDYWDEAERVEYEDTPETRLYRDQMWAINSWLEQADIDYEFALGEDGRPVDTNDRFLRRIFNQGRFDRGGRLFGGFWQRMKKRQRLDSLWIEGEPVVELDFSQMGPRIMYGYTGAKFPTEDAYLIPGLENFRSGVKTVFNAMLAASAPLSRMPRGVRKDFPDRVSIREVTAKIIEAHPALKDIFFAGLGHFIQFRESQILVALLLDLKKERIAALPIHDAVIVPRSSTKLVKERMLTTFRELTGIEGSVREEK